jgi:hypothetical protein
MRVGAVSETAPTGPVRGLRGPESGAHGRIADDGSPPPVVMAFDLVSAAVVTRRP